MIKIKKGGIERKTEKQKNKFAPPNIIFCSKMHFKWLTLNFVNEINFCVSFDPKAEPFYNFTLFYKYGHLNEIFVDVKHFYHLNLAKHSVFKRYTTGSCIFPW